MSYYIVERILCSYDKVKRIEIPKREDKRSEEEMKNDTYRNKRRRNFFLMMTNDLQF